MANNLATLNGKLKVQLRDSTYAVWTTGEMDDLLNWACASLWPRLAKPVRETVTLADDDGEYTLTTVAEIERVDRLDADGKLIGFLPPRTWEFWADQETVGGTLYFNPVYARTGETLRVHGYAPLNLTTNLPSDRVVPLVLAKARVEAWHRMIGERARYAKWSELNQKENVTVTELATMINQAEQDVFRLTSEMKTWRKPKPA